MLSDVNYLYIEKADEHIENLFLMTENRKESNIVLLSSNNFRLVSAKELNFCVIPITKFVRNEVKDIQLNLVEKYLILLRYNIDMKCKNNIDFGYLTSNLRRPKNKESK